MKIERPQLIAFASLISLVAALAMGWQWFTAPTTELIAVAPQSSSSVSVGVVVVDVAGAVKNPGVFELPAGSRVQDAVEAAGGLKRRQPAGVNLARVLVDGEQIFIGTQSTDAPNSKLNINRATAAQLEALPGVGPVLAESIIDYRDSHGGFRRIEELDSVSGIGPSMMRKLKDSVTVG